MNWLRPSDIKIGDKICLPKDPKKVFKVFRIHEGDKLWPAQIRLEYREIDNTFQYRNLTPEEFTKAGYIEFQT